MKEELGAGDEVGHRAFQNDSLEEQRENVQQQKTRFFYFLMAVSKDGGIFVSTGTDALFKM